MAASDPGGLAVAKAMAAGWKRLADAMVSQEMMGDVSSARRKTIEWHIRIVTHPEESSRGQRFSDVNQYFHHFFRDVSPDSDEIELVEDLIKRWHGIIPALDSSEDKFWQRVCNVSNVYQKWSSYRREQGHEEWEAPLREAVSVGFEWIEQIEDPEGREEIWRRTFDVISWYHRSSGSVNNAEDFARWLEFTEGRLAQDRDSFHFNRLLALLVRREWTRRRSMGDSGNEAAMIRKQIDARKRMVELRPGEAWAYMELIEAWRHLSSSLARNGEKEPALVACIEAYDEVKEPLRRFPGNWDLKRKVAELIRDTGNRHHSLQQWDESIDRFLEADRWIREAYDGSGDVGHLTLRFGIINQLGDQEVRRGDLASAEEWYRQSIELRRQACLRLPDNPKFSWHLVVGYRKLAEHLRKDSNRVEEAIVILGEAEKLIRETADWETLPESDRKVEGTVRSLLDVLQGP